MARPSVTVRVGKFRPDRDGIREVARSKGVQAAVDGIAAQVADSAEAMCEGAAYGHDVQPGKNRAHALAYTANYPAMRDNARNNTLLKALNSHT